MFRRIVSGIMFALLVVSILTLTFNIQLVKASGTIYIRADGSIDPPTAPISSSDNVTYLLTDNIEFDESIIVERDNIVIDGVGYTVEGAGTGVGIHVIWRTNVTIKNVKVEMREYGIYLWESTHCNIIGNNITNNGWGIALYPHAHYNSIVGNSMTANYWCGIWGGEEHCSSNHNMISENNIAGSNTGIYLAGSRNNSIIGNNITGIGQTGIRLDWCSAFNILGNNVTHYQYGMCLYKSPNCSMVGNTISNNEKGITLETSSDNWISRNDVATNYFGIHLTGSYNETVASNSVTDNVYGIYCDSSSNNSINENDIANNNNYGIYLASSSNNIIFGNNIENNHDGMQLDGSSNNTVAGNNITGNDWYGMELWWWSSNNTFYHNNFIGNFHQLNNQYIKLNVWDDGYPSGGNYWSDYSGVDVKNGPSQDFPGSDGIGDTTYIIPLYPYANNVDHYPLMNPYGAPPSPTYALTITTTVGGTTDPAPGTYSYTVNSSVQVRAIPNSNYLFHHWELESINVGSANPYTVLMSTNHILKAVFSPISPPKPPVGGYSIQIEATTTKPLTLYLALITILAVGFTTIKRKTTRK